MIEYIFSKKHYFLLLICLMIFVSAVSASDTNITDDGNDNLLSDDTVDDYDLTTDTMTTSSLKSASKSTYYVNNKNYNTYFDEDGYINEDNVAKESTLILNDTFRNKTIVISDYSVNLSGVKDKTILYNSSIFIDQSPVKISNLIIKNTNKNIETAIFVDANNVIVDNCKIYVNSTNDAYGIYLLGNNSKITNNIINVTGPSDEINWDTDVARTLSLTVLSNNNIIANNTISVSSSVEKSNPGTIEAVSLQGDYNGRTSKNNSFLNNNVTALGNSYVYGVNLGQSVDNNKIENNNIKVQGGYFADALQIFSTASNLTINNNTISAISYNLADGIVISKDNMAGLTENNTITNNKVNVVGNETNLIEVYRGVNTTISNNTVESTSNKASGIVATGSNIKINKNNIKLNASSNSSSPISLKLSNIVSVTNNEVESNCVYSVELANSTKINVTDNILNSIIKGDNSVNYTDKNNIIKNNSESRIIETTTTTNPIKAQVNDKITLTANVKTKNGISINNGYVIFKVNNQSLKDKNNNLIKAYVKNSVARVNYTVDKSWNKDKISIVAIYSGSGDIQSSKSNPQAINVTKRAVNVKLSCDKQAVRCGDSVILSVYITDKSQSINGGKVIFKLNGQTIKDKNGNSIILDVKDGFAVTSYVFDNGMSSKNCTFTAVYSNSAYERSEGNVGIFINKSRQEIVVSPVKTKTNTTRITGKIVEINGKAIRGTTQVAIKINGQTFGVTAAVNGIINTTINTKFKPGIYKLKIVAGENYRYFANSLDSVIEKE